MVIISAEMHVVFLLPGAAEGPTGGYKVVMEHAARMVAEGYRVTVCYAGSIFYRQKPLKFKLSGIVRYLQKYFRGFSYGRWMAINPKIKERLTFSLNYCHVPHGADRYIATSPYTAWYLDRYPVDADRKFYFIQGKEDWGSGLRAILDDTYHMALNKITIASWLRDMLRFQYAEDSALVCNGFDFGYFKMLVPAQKRNHPVVSMLWHDMALKDCRMGWEALKIVKKEMPDLQVKMFGTPERPDFLPEWVEYTRRPSRDKHNEIYNSSQVFMATSRSEGWGLTVGEAMICGAAVACTDCGGFREMATDGVTALISPVGDAEAMAANVIKLLKDDGLRIGIAQQAAENIHRFTWENSHAAMMEALGLPTVTTYTQNCDNR